MIIKILSNKGFAAFEYNSQKIEKGHAEVTAMQNFDASMLGIVGKINAAQCHDILKYQDGLRSDAKSTQIHVTISSHKRDDDKERLTACANEYMEKMGYGKQPYIVYFHKDTQNNHIHIVSTRVKLDRTIITNSQEKRRSSQICREFNSRYSHSLADTVQQQFRLDCLEALKWAFADAESFASLMHTYGYKCKNITPNAKSIVFIKDGSICGKVTKEQLQQNFQRYADGISFRKNKDLDKKSRSPIFSRKQLIYAKLTNYNKKGYTLREIERMEEFRKQLGLKLHIIPRIDKQGKQHKAWMCQDFIGKTFYKGSDIMNLDGFSMQPDVVVKKELFNAVAPELMLDKNLNPLPWREARKKLSMVGYELIMYKGNARVRVIGTNDLFDVPQEFKKAMMKAQRIVDVRAMEIHSIAEARVLAILNFVPYNEIVPNTFAPVNMERLNETKNIIQSIFANTPENIAEKLAEEKIAVIMSGDKCFFFNQNNPMLFPADDINIPLTLDDIEKSGIKFISMDYLSDNYERWNQLGESSEQEQFQNESQALSSKVPYHPDNEDENYRERSRSGIEPIEGDTLSPVGNGETRTANSLSLFDILIEVSMGFGQNLASYQRGAQNSKKDKKKKDRVER